MARARTSRGKKWGPHKRGNKLCKKCGRSHSASEHWSHAARGGAKYNFDQTPQPKGRKTAAGNPSRAVVPGKRRPKGMTKAQARAARKRMAATSARKKAKTPKRAKATAGRKKRKTVARKAASTSKKKRSAAQVAATQALVARNRGGGKKAGKSKSASKSARRSKKRSSKTSGAPRTPWSS